MPLKENLGTEYSYLSITQQCLIQLLERSGFTEDMIVGTCLLLKDDDWAMKALSLWIYKTHPTPTEINESLKRYIKEK